MVFAAHAVCSVCAVSSVPGVTSGADGSRARSARARAGFTRAKRLTIAASKKTAAAAIQRPCPPGSRSRATVPATTPHPSATRARRGIQAVRAGWAPRDSSIAAQAGMSPPSAKKSKPANTAKPTSIIGAGITPWRGTWCQASPITTMPRAAPTRRQATPGCRRTVTRAAWTLPETAASAARRAKTQEAWRSSVSRTSRSHVQVVARPAAPAVSATARPHAIACGTRRGREEAGDTGSETSDRAGSDERQCSFMVDPIRAGFLRVPGTKGRRSWSSRLARQLQASESSSCQTTAGKRQLVLPDDSRQTTARRAGRQQASDRSFCRIRISRLCTNWHVARIESFPISFGFAHGGSVERVFRSGRLLAWSNPGMVR